MTRYLFIGTSTQKDGQHRPDGIFVLRMDPVTGHLERLHAVESGPNPSFLAFSPDQRFLFAVNETLNGAVCGFAVDGSTAGLTFINREAVGGDLPCYLTTSPDGRTLLAANYWSGVLSVFPLGEDGKIGARSQRVYHRGAASKPDQKMTCQVENDGALYELPRAYTEAPASVNPGRQEATHAHSILPDPSGQYYLSADLGMDRVWIYRLANGLLAANPRPGGSGADLKPGAGPRHIAFHPNQRYAYVSNELDSTVTTFAWDSRLGALEPVQNISTLPGDFTGENAPAHLALTPEGRFLYLSNRGHNSLAIFKVDADSGRLAAAGHASTLGNWPRNFCIDPDGRYLVCANQMSEDVFVFAIDPATGALTQTGEGLSVPAPLFVTVVDLR